MEHPEHILNICRFCLNGTQLAPLATLTDHSLTMVDIELFTGIENLRNENQLYMICDACECRLKKFAAFRSICMSNDVFFKKLYEAHTEQLMEEDYGVFFDCTLRAREVSSHSKSDSKNRSHKEYNSVQTAPASESLVDMQYCANQIDIGEPFSSDDDQIFEALQNPLPNKSKRKTTIAERLAADRIKEANEGNVAKRPIPVNELCELCGKQVQRVRSHMRHHSAVKELKYACTHCPMKMSDPGNLQRHIDAVHFKKIIKHCEICGKGFTSRLSHVGHLRVYHGIGRTFDCRICDKQFNHRSNYAEHFQLHHTGDEKNFKCETCDMSFKTRKLLRKHYAVHSSEQPYTCGQCPKRFKSRHARKTHELTHTGISFKCELCDKSYRYKALLNIHMRKLHPVEPPPNEESE
uniref:Protein krueppel n=1 Tax=Anopheles farauti TaxID=69004 RepID=A0A9I3GJK9_9DIPT